MRAHLVFDHHRSAPWELPDLGRPLVFGSAPDCDQRLLDLGPPRGLELWRERERWFLRDLGAGVQPTLNGLRVESPRALFDGDRVDYLGLRFRFCDPAELGFDDLCSPLVRAPDDERARADLADALRRRGDSLGDYLLQAVGRQRTLFPAMLDGALTYRCQAGHANLLADRGLARLAFVRTKPPLPLEDWQETLDLLFETRVAWLLRELVVDAVPLAQTAAELRGARDDDPVLSAMEWLARHPRLPASLERVTLGFSLPGAPGSTVPASEALVRRAPRLAGTQVFHVGTTLVLRAVEGAVAGLDAGADLSGAWLLRWCPGQPPRLEPATETCFDKDEILATFRLVDGRPVLSVDPDVGPLTVNHAPGPTFLLLPGDRLRLPGGERLEVAFAG